MRRAWRRWPPRTSRGERLPYRPALLRSLRGRRQALSSHAPDLRRCTGCRRLRPPPWRSPAPRSCGAGRGACTRGRSSRRFALHQRRDGVDGAEVLLVELLILDDDAEGVLQKHDELDCLERRHHSVVDERLVVWDVPPAGNVLLQPPAYG